MEVLAGFLVVWSLFGSTAENIPATQVSSKYYWSHKVCIAAKARLDEAIIDAGLAKSNTVCVPFMQEAPSSEWVAANVIGPCEPYYDDCGDIDQNMAAATIATGMKWYALVQKAHRQPGSGPIGPRPFLTPEQRKIFRAPHPAVQ